MDNSEKTQAKPKNGQLLIVDDEIVFLKLLVRIFENHYEVKSATSGEDALLLLKNGFNPGVILSDQIMPNMKGSEFLEASMAIVPNAIRIILTGHTDPKEIIACINQGHAYMYLTKPFAEIQLVQSVKVAFDQFYAAQKNKKLITELKNQMNELNAKNTKLNKLMQDNRNLFTQTLHSITGMLNHNETYYFRPHAKNVASIAKAIAEEIELSPESVALIALSSLLINIVYYNMPKKFILNEYNDLSNDFEKNKYIEIFMNSVGILGKIDSLQKHGAVLSQIWEHHDGSGVPKKISGTTLTKEAQIITIANFYHNSVYKIRYDDLREFEKNGYLIQSKEVTRQRHDETIKQLYRRANWYDLDLFNAFHNIVKIRKIPEVIPIAETLTCITNDKLCESGFSREDLINNKPQKPIIIEEDSQDSSIPQREQNKFIEKDIQVARLEPGMVVGQNVVTKNGMLIIRQDNTLDENTVKNIQHLEATGMLPKSITIMVSNE